MAASVPKKTLCINPYEINKLKTKELLIYKKLLKILELDMTKFEKKVKKYKKRRELYIRRKISDKLYLKIKGLKLPHVYFIKEYERIYFSGPIFSNVIGFTNVDDVGQEGIEFYRNNLLKSEKGIKKVRKDNLGRIIETINIIKPPRSGQDITLSLDKNIQGIGYNILRKYVTKFSADSASLILIKTDTGEIISMINYPSFNPNNRNEIHEFNSTNKSVLDVFEPGSTMKPFTVFAALDSGKFSSKDKIDTSPGFIKIGKHTVQDIKNNGILSVSEIIEKSSNIGAIKLSRQLEKKDIWRTLNNFQFGEPLYLDIAGSITGNLDHYSSWEDSQSDTISYGYGVSTTLLHLANAYTILANKGKYVQLTYEKVNNKSLINKDSVVDKIISDEVLKMMTRVTESQTGTGKKAKLSKYTVAGKTGTARINIKGKYKKNKHFVFFAGIVPATRPEYVSVVVVRKPKGGGSGGKNAAPIFKEFMSHSLNLLQVYPDKR